MASFYDRRLPLLFLSMISIDLSLLPYHLLSSAPRTSSYKSFTVKPPRVFQVKTVFSTYIVHHCCRWTICKRSTKGQLELGFHEPRILWVGTSLEKSLDNQEIFVKLVGVRERVTIINGLRCSTIRPFRRLVNFFQLYLVKNCDMLCLRVLISRMPLR